MTEEKNIEDICKECKGQRALKDIPHPMCGDDAALFYALHKAETKITGTYQKVGKNYDVYCVYEEKK